MIHTTLKKNMKGKIVRSCEAEIRGERRQGEERGEGRGARKRQAALLTTGRLGWHGAGRGAWLTDSSAAGRKGIRLLRPPPPRLHRFLLFPTLSLISTFSPFSFCFSLAFNYTLLMSMCLLQTFDIRKKSDQQLHFRLFCAKILV